MARTTVRIVLPSANADQTIKLLETVLAEHTRRETATPGFSPLKASVITAIQTLLGPAKADRLKSQELAAQAAALLEKSNKALGLAEGQNLRTEDTGLFYAAQVRDTLVAELRGKENEIETFGFKVVVGSAASPTRKPKA